jgi:hypothetical protein
MLATRAAEASEKTWATGKTKDISCNQSSEHDKPELRHIILGE